MRIIRPCSVLLTAVLVLVSCSDPSAPRTPTSITVLSGGGQTARVAERLPQPVVVEVRDVDGRPVRGAAVTWTITAGGGFLTEAGATTDGAGRAQVQWTLGSAAGVNRLRAGVTGVAPTTVTATAESAAPASAIVVAGDGQIGLALRPLGEAIAVAVRDAFGNGVSGTAVTFTPSQGTITPGTVTTNAQGFAEVSWTLGAPGAQTLAVDVGGLEGESLQVAATALSSDEVVELQNGQTLTDVSAEKGRNLYYRVTVPDNVSSLTVTTVGGPGDADLFLRHELLPTTSVNACESTTPSTNESCTVQMPGAGEWYVLLDAFSTYSDLSIRATYIVGGTMIVAMSGLPDGATGDVLVTGPGRFERRLTSSTTLPALEPGRYTLTSNFIRHNDAVYVSSPETQNVDITMGVESTISVGYGETAGGLNLDIVRAWITQSVQRSDGSIPLVAGRDGLLRVFARGNAVSTEMPAVRARFYQNGALVQTLTISAPSATLPVSHDEASLTSTWNVVVPGALLQEGTALLVDVDPANEVGETDEADNHFPESATPLPLDVRAAQPLLARLVPVVQANGQQGDVTNANRDSYVTDAQALYPLPSVDVDVRAPYTFNKTLPASYDSTWQRLLSEINALRLAEDPQRYYYGVIKPNYSNGGTGLGYIGARASIGVDWDNWRALTLAHEWGHNFGRRHVDCGNPSGPDPNYPYDGGRLGHHGYDIRTNEIRTIDTHFDLMSYCQPGWASDYTYEAVLAARGTQAGPSTALAGKRAETRNPTPVTRTGAPEPVLLVWGTISPDGAVLEPSFEITAAPARPAGSGPYRLTGTNDSGATVLDLSFDAYEIDHLPGARLFAYAIPLREMGGEAPAEIRLRGPGISEIRRQMAAPARGDEVRVVRDGTDGVRVQWNSVRSPVLMIRDGQTGEILSFARGGDVRVTTSAREVEVNMSNGVKSTMRRIVVSR